MKVTLQNLTKVFPSRSKSAQADVIAVNDFSFDIPDGELVGLLGPSGCGKSTALNLICGLLSPTSGRILFGDDDITDLPPERRGVGLVFQNYALYPHMTVQQNILFPLQNLKGADKLTKADMLARVQEVAELVQIETLMDRKPAQLSGGQQQRVAIARALVKMPRVLLLDEPLSNLDARLRLQTREELRRIQRKMRITTVFVTHDQEEAMSISDHIVVMRAGIAEQIGKPQDVYDNPANLFVATFLGTPPINVFHGRIDAGSLYIGKDVVLDVQGIPGGEVYVGVRPEGFVLHEAGRLHCSLGHVEVMGRDVSIVASHDALVNPETSVRAIIDAQDAANFYQGEASYDLRPGEVHLEETGYNLKPGEVHLEEVCFDLRPGKVYLFDKDSGKRLDFDMGGYDGKK